MPDPLPPPLPLSGSLGAEEFGRTLPGGGVTGVSVKNWARDDGLESAEQLPGGRWVIKDPAKAREWVRINKAELWASLEARAAIGRGGKRSRAGRPRKNPNDPKWRETDRRDPGDPSSLPFTPPESGEERSGGSTSAGAHAGSASGGVNPDADRKLRSQADKEFEQARKFKLDNDAKAGALLPAADVRSAWTRAVEVVGQSLDSIAAGAAERVVMRTGLSGDHRAIVEAEVRAEVERARAAVVKAMQAAASSGPTQQSDNATTQNIATSDIPSEVATSENESHGEAARTGTEVGE